MAEPSVEVGEAVEKSIAESESTAQGKETEDTSNNDVLSKGENDSNTFEGAVKNSEAEKPPNVATNIEENENGANDKNTDEIKENSLSENLKEEAKVNQETQKTSDDLSKNSMDNSTNMATFKASSTEFKSKEEAGNQDGVDQTRDNLLQSNNSVDSKDTENLEKENAEIATEAAGTQDKTSTGYEFEEETVKDLTSNDEKDADNNIVETDASQDVSSGENNDSSKKEKPERPVDIQREATRNEVKSIENVDVATDNLNENGANDKNTDEVKENSPGENLKEEAKVNQETQKTSNDWNKDSMDNTTNMATAEASSIELKSKDKAGNQDGVDQTRDNLLQSNNSVDNKDREKNLAKENAEIATEAAGTHDKTSTGNELKEEIVKDVTSNDNKNTDNDIVETDASQDINSGEKRDSCKTEKRERPVDTQSEATTNEVKNIENVDVATDKEHNAAMSDIKPTEEISGDKAKISDEVGNTETENKDGNVQKASGENGEGVEEVEKPIEINTQKSKEDSEHGSVDTGKTGTQGDSELPSKVIKQSGIIESNSSEDESTKSNETPSSPEQTVPENQSETATTIEGEIPSEKVGGEVNTKKDSGNAEKELYSKVKEKSEGDHNISEVTEKLEQTDEIEEKDNGMENAETKANAEKSEKEYSGTKSSEGSNVETAEEIENSGIKQDSQEDDGVSKDNGNESEVTKDQEHQNLESKQQENKAKQENTEDKKLEGETGDKVSESKEESYVKDVAESDKKSKISSEKIESDMNTNNDAAEAKTAGDVSLTEEPAEVKPIDRSMEVVKDEEVEAGGNVASKENAEKPKEENSGDRKQNTELSVIIVKGNDTQQDSAKEDEASKVPNNEPEVTKDEEDQTLESKSNVDGIEKENAGNRKSERETKNNAVEPEAVSDVKNSEETAEKSMGKAINESTKAEVITITPTTMGSEHETVEDNVDETNSDTKETSVENAETDHASAILNETAKESGKSEQPKPQHSEESKMVEETTTSVKEEDQAQIATEETIADATSEGSNPEQNVVTASENNKNDVDQVKTEDTDQPEQVRKDASDIQTGQETKNLDDKIAKSGSKEGVIASEIFIDKKDKSLLDTHARKELESNDEINVAEKSEESKNESDSTKPTVDQDDTRETSPQGPADGYKTVESEDQTTVVSETTVKSVDQANDGTSAESTAQGADTQEALIGVTGGSSEVSEDKKADIQKMLSGVTGGSSEVSEDKNAGTEGIPESKEKALEKQTDENNEKTTIQSKNDGLHSEKSTKTSDEAFSTTEAKDLGIDSGTNTGTKEENVDSAAVKESEDLHADNKTKIKLDESSDATAESRDSGKTAETKEETEIKMDQDVDKETAPETHDERNKAEISGVPEDKNADTQEVPSGVTGGSSEVSEDTNAGTEGMPESKEKALEKQTDENHEETTIQSKNDGLYSEKSTKASDEAFLATEAKDLGIDSGTTEGTKEENVNSAAVKESEDLHADNKTKIKLDESSDATAESRDSGKTAKTKEETEIKVDKDVDKETAPGTNDERNKVEIGGVSEDKHAGTQKVLEYKEKSLEIQKDRNLEEIPIQSKDDSPDSEKSTKANDVVLSATEAKDLGIDTGIDAETKGEKVNSTTVKESEDLDADNKRTVKVDKNSDATLTSGSNDSGTTADTNEESEKKVDQDVDKNTAAEAIDERNKAKIGGVSDDKNAGTQTVVNCQEKALEIQTECKDQTRDETIIKSKDDNLDIEKSTKANDEVLSTTKAKDPAINTGTTAESKKDDSTTVEESEDLHAENKTKINVDESSDATVTAESKDQSVDEVSAPDSKDESEIVIEEVEPVKEKISIAEKTKDSTETSTVVPAEQPEQYPEARKVKEKQSTFGNTEDLAVLGVSTETKKETKTEVKKVKSWNKCVDVDEKDKNVSTKAQDAPHAVEVTKDAKELKTLEKPTKAAENQKVNDGKEEGDYVLVDREGIKTEEINANDVHQQNSISQNDNTGKDDSEKPEEEYEEDFCENDEDLGEVKEEERPGEEEVKATHMEKETHNVTSERPVIEVTADFLELLEGFCMAACQEFPSNIVDFACSYFTRIYRRRKALRKYSIEVSDLAMLSDVNWCGNI